MRCATSADRRPASAARELTCDEASCARSGSRSRRRHAEVAGTADRAVRDRGIAARHRGARIGKRTGRQLRREPRDARIARRERPRALEVEARVVAGRLREAAAAQPLAAEPQQLAHAFRHLLRLERPPRFRDQARARLRRALGRAAQHRERLAEITRGRRRARAGQQQPLALLAELRGEEGDADVVRLQRARRIDVARRVVELAGEDRLLGEPEQRIDDLVEAGRRLRLARRLLQHLPEEVRRALARRQHQLAARIGLLALVEQCTRGGVERRRRRGRRRTGTAARRRRAGRRARTGRRDRRRSESRSANHSTPATTSAPTAAIAGTGSDGRPRWATPRPAAPPPRGRPTRRRRGLLAHAGMFLVVPPQRRLDEQPHPLRRHRLVQEAVDVALVICAASWPWCSAPPATTSTRSGNCCRSRAVNSATGPGTVAASISATPQRPDITLSASSDSPVQIVIAWSDVTTSSSVSSSGSS